MDSADQVVAEIVSDAISKSGNTNKAVASAIGVSTTTMSRRLNAKRPFQVSEIMRIAQVLGIRAGRLLDEAMEKLS